LFLSFARAFRCFGSIRRLCEEPLSDGEDPLVLTRALISLALRSIWPVSTNDPLERELRSRRWTWYTLRWEVKRLRALADPRDADHLKTVESDLAETEAWFTSQQLTPNELDEAAI